jgi:hypothetical protein
MSMFRPKRNEDAERFYLLPGQGGKEYRRKQKFILKWAIIAALVFSCVLTLLLYWLDKLKF